MLVFHQRWIICYKSTIAIYINGNENGNRIKKLKTVFIIIYSSFYRGDNEGFFLIPFHTSHLLHLAMVVH